MLKIKMEEYLSKKTKEILLSLGYKELTKIQRESIPLILEGKDVIIKSKTGTGKTASFIIPFLAEGKIIKDSSTQFLAIVPTRELASQINEEARKLFSHLGLRTLSVYGKSSMQMQFNSFKKGVEIVIGTPGRILDHLKKKTLKMNNIKVFVLDEVDEMLNRGFSEDIETITKMLPSNCQKLLSSATSSRDVHDYSRRFLKNPEYVDAGIDDKKEEIIRIKQYFLEIRNREKNKKTLDFLINKGLNSSIIIFVNTKRGVEELENFLNNELRGKEIRVDYIHGDLNQFRRNRVLENFRKGNFSVLIATDVAARGIHIDGIKYVLNYDFPQNMEIYEHRIGRTGRLDSYGTSITFIEQKDLVKIKRIMKLKNFKIESISSFSDV